jgi:hypothetical protein
MWITDMTGSSAFNASCNELRESVFNPPNSHCGSDQTVPAPIRSLRHDPVYVPRTSGAFRLFTAGARFTPYDDITCWTLGDHPWTLRDLDDFGSRTSNNT